MQIEAIIDKCLTFQRYDDLEVYLKEILGDDLTLRRQFETRVWQMVNSSELRETIADYIMRIPTEGYDLVLISELKSTSDCLISILRIIEGIQLTDGSKSWNFFP